MIDVMPGPGEKSADEKAFDGFLGKCQNPKVREILESIWDLRDGHVPKGMEQMTDDSEMGAEISRRATAINDEMKQLDGGAYQELKAAFATLKDAHFARDMDWGIYEGNAKYVRGE